MTEFVDCSQAITNASISPICLSVPVHGHGSRGVRHYFHVLLQWGGEGAATHGGSIDVQGD